MTRISTLILIAALTLGGLLPAGASSDPLRLEPCDTGLPPLTVDGLDETITMDLAPQGLVLIGPEQATTYALDLSGQDTEEGVDHHTSARVSALLAWEVVVNDYDLILGDQTTEGFQPLDPAEEFALATFDHCDDVRVGVSNYSATGGDDVDLEVIVNPR